MLPECTANGELNPCRGSSGRADAVPLDRAAPGGLKLMCKQGCHFFLRCYCHLLNPTPFPPQSVIIAVGIEKTKQKKKLLCGSVLHCDFLLKIIMGSHLLELENISLQFSILLSFFTFFIPIHFSFFVCPQLLPAILSFCSDLVFNYSSALSLSNIFKIITN